MQWLWFGLALRDGAARKSDMLSFLPVGNDLILDLIVCCVCILVLPLVDNVYSIYDLTDDDFAQSPDYEQLYTELTGAVALFIESNGIQ